MNNDLRDGLLDLPDVDVKEKGPHQMLRAAGVRLHTAQHSIVARLATREDTELPDEKPGAALPTMQRTTYDEPGRLVEYGRHVYRASR